jgi:hypothetical protein
MPLIELAAVEAVAAADTAEFETAGGRVANVAPDVKARRGGSVVVVPDADEAVLDEANDDVAVLADVAGFDECAVLDDAVAAETALSQGMTMAAGSRKSAPVVLQQLRGSGRGLCETWQQKSVRPLSQAQMGATFATFTIHEYRIRIIRDLAQRKFRYRCGLWRARILPFVHCV